MRPLVITSASSLLTALCAAGSWYGVAGLQSSTSPSMQLTYLLLTILGGIGCTSGLWTALSYAALLRPPHRSSPLVRFAATFGTPAVRRTLAALTVFSMSALPATADTGTTDLGWGAPLPEDKQSAVVAPNSYTVQPGDTLWSIARKSLGPKANTDEIAAATKRWFQQNSDSIANPDVIFPGQILHTPQDLS